MYTLYTLHTTHYTLHIKIKIRSNYTYYTYYTLHTTQYTVHTTHWTTHHTQNSYTLHTTHYTQEKRKSPSTHNTHCTHYTVHSTHYTVHTSQITHYTQYAYYTLHTTHITHITHHPFLNLTRTPSKIIVLWIAIEKTILRIDFFSWHCRFFLLRFPWSFFFLHGTKKTGDEGVILPIGGCRKKRVWNMLTTF